MNESPKPTPESLPSGRKESAPLVLHIRNMGPVPSKKNRKVISRNWKTGKPFLRTDDDEAAWAKAVILDLLSQFNSAYRAAVAMQTTPSARSWIASSAPVTDSTKHIKKLMVEVIDVPQGQEGATIVITNLDNEISGVDAAPIFNDTLAQVNSEENNGN